MAEDKSERAERKDKPDTEVVVRANLNRQMTRSGEFMSVYANDTQLELSPWDVRFIFGVIDEIATPERATTVVKQVGEVRMSLPHAKRVAQILIKQIAHYEEVTKAAIPVPE